MGFVGQFNEVVFAWLGSLGYTGAYNDRVAKWKIDNGITTAIGI